MKKEIIILFFLPLFGFSQATLIFSEYGEGSSFNKWIEIYNPTSQDIPLDDYRYNFCWNGCDNFDWEFSINFDTGYILPSGETYLITHYDANTNLLNAANQTTNLVGNGNDVVAIYNASLNTIVDIIGVFDTANITGGWDVDGVANATEDHTMIRKPDVCSGNMGDWGLSDGSSIASEWIVGNIDDDSNINLHNANCVNTASIFIPATQSFNRALVKQIDLLGRRSNSKNQFVIYVYDDGTVEKRLVIE